MDNAAFPWLNTREMPTQFIMSVTQVKKEKKKNITKKRDI